MTDRYIIRDGQVVPEPNLLAWAEFMERRENVVLREYKCSLGAIRLMFLGVSPADPPVLFLVQATDANGVPYVNNRCYVELRDADRDFDRFRFFLSECGW